ncbi:hypothetical protein KR52_05150 [Synechococcus sp. KORDI-52]|uniref:hypothetical protein n=1 Tax=Synechococcus sp. KORDI-52 TaxID=585425 RepID=UPI0004E09AA8|nr:hypothetical protein [Synechococcus sp. KORDI-52]AII48531.1 hypothetical protein KR52_05150 [Synechococcus sp. KORDI-52]
MRLISLQRQFLWPADVPLVELRSWIRQQLAADGDVLRWALTSVRSSADGGRIVDVEAVISA